MKILNDTINMSSSYSASMNRAVKETTRVWIGDKRPDFESLEKGQLPDAQQTRASFSAVAMNLSHASAKLDSGSGAASRAPF